MTTINHTDKKPKEKTYQLSDVFEDTSIIAEVVTDLKFEMKLRQLSKLSDKRRQGGSKNMSKHTAGGAVDIPD